jgi:hypothetical protein
VSRDPCNGWQVRVAGVAGDEATVLKSAMNPVSHVIRESRDP